MSKIMLLTFNPVFSEILMVPEGREVRGDIIVYSGGECRILYANIPPVSKQRTISASRRPETLMDNFNVDINDVREVYVYVGFEMMVEASRLLGDLRKKGKLVHMIACNCQEKEKKQLARDLDVDLISSECGGQIACAHIVERRQSS